MTNKNDTTISKFISLVLRHKPETIGLVLDLNGWASVSDLLSKSATANVKFGLDDLKRIVAESGKQRFAFNENFTKIRANQGHSIKVDLELETLTPPDILFHGTAKRFIDSIMRQGLISMSRHDVHMTENKVTALETGKRHGDPVLITIDARRMAADGYIFKRSANNVWLTATVPPKYLAPFDRT